MTTKPMEKTTDELVEYLRDVHEKYIVELKQASDLPKSFWESYSAFSIDKESSKSGASKMRALR